ncbi:MAG TPA: hypothetical protein VFS77_22925 [Pyrinomonadaceae bacterium]|nr:hypothetical protein [Pyrinomonadaceae bacterium]
MNDQGQRLIFRVEAIRRNSRGGGEAILPQFSSPGIIWLLWTLIGLSLAGGLLLWFLQVPVYAKATAILLPADYYSKSGHNARVSHEPLVAVVIPARTGREVRVGQRVFWSFSKTGPRVSRIVMEVEPSVRSPESLQTSLGLHGRTTASITEPSVIAIVNLGPVPDDVPASAYVGSVYYAEVEVGTKRVISLLPFVGRLIGI